MRRSPALLALLLLGADRDVTFSSAASAPAALTGRCVALVIGNSAYGGEAQIPQAAKDARLMGDALSGIGCEVLPAYDLDKKGMDDQIGAFLKRVRGQGKEGTASVAFFYYAGHGIMSEAEVNYMIPLNPNLSAPADLIERNVPSFDNVIADLEGAGAPMNVALFDACRSNVWEKRIFGATRGGTPTLAPPKVKEPPSKISFLIGFSTTPGQPARDDGVYARQPSTWLSTPNLRIESVLKRTRQDVQDKSGQAPYLEDHARDDTA